MKVVQIITSVALLAGLIMIPSTIFIVDEAQKGIVTRLGNIQVDADKESIVYSPGIHLKYPFITTSHYYDVRLQTLDVDESRMVTSEKKDLLVDYFAKWRIENVPLFYKRTGGRYLQAQTLIEQKINDGLRAEFGKRTIQEVVSGERQDIMELLLAAAKSSMGSLGIDVIDVRIKRIDLPSEVSSAVYQRMRAERHQFAAEHRAKGRAKSNAIRAHADASVVIIRAAARKQAKVIRGEADAQAATIYADTYKADPEFFSFYRSINAYKTVFNASKDLLVLNPNSHFFKYFNNLSPLKNVPRRGSAT